MNKYIENATIMNKLYQNGITMEVIAKKFKCDRHVVSKVIKSIGGEIRTPSEYIRKYEINESYFDKINSKDKAYFLGLLYADGCNHSHGKAISIKLLADDRHILDAFNKKIYKDYKSHNLVYTKACSCSFKEINGTIRTYKAKPKYTFNVHSSYMSSRLRLLGLIPVKSSNLIFPTETQVPQYLLSHFIRGYFDGDGCVSSSVVNNGKYKTSSVSFNGTLEFLLKLKEILKNEININSGIYETPNFKNNNQAILRSGGNKQVLKFLDWLYKDSKYYKLDRKYAQYISIKRHHAKHYS